MANAAHIE